MTAPDITRLRALYEAATTGVWEWLPKADSDDREPDPRWENKTEGAFYAGDICLAWFGDCETYYPTSGTPPEDYNATFITAAHNTFPALLAAAERLARYEAAMVSEEARETVAAAICEADLCGDAYAWADQATAALAALARVVGE